MRQLSSIERCAKNLNSYILQLDIIKEYQKYEALIMENKEIHDLEIKMKALQKKIVNQKAKQDQRVEETIQTYSKIKDAFESHPLVVNYLYLKEEVDILLQEINVSINGQLSNKGLTKR